MTKNILVTGGLGYIGSHLCVELIKKNYKIFIIDNLSNSKMLVLKKIYKITKKNLCFINLI
jgi:UDP-glucose 4-epimerase